MTCDWKILPRRVPPKSFAWTINRSVKIVFPAILHLVPKQCDTNFASNTGDFPAVAQGYRTDQLMDDKDKFIDQTADIVSAYVSNNTVAADQISALINQVHAALVRVAAGQGEAGAEPLRPAVPVKKSITPDYLVCLEDGKKFKSLKRHLRSQYNMTPEQYREKWNLPADYPMVAPNYAQARSQLAKQMGLGQQRRRRR